MFGTRSHNAPVAPTPLRADRGPDQSVGIKWIFMAYVYILKTKSGKYYVGSTENLSTRLAHHIGGHTPSTKKLGAEALLLSQEYETLKDARSVEYKIKNLKRKDYIEKMLKDGYIKVKPS